MGSQNPVGHDAPVPAKATAEVTVGADWTQKAVDSINQTLNPVLTVVAVKGPLLRVQLVIDDLGAYVGIGKKVPTPPGDREELMVKVVRELLDLDKVPAASVKLIALEVD